MNNTERNDCTQGQFLMTVGAPGCGKSTWSAKMESEGWWAIRPDVIRWEVFREDFHPLVEREVWAIVAASLKGIFNLYSLEGRGSQKVILDATNLTRKSRSRWIKMAKAHDFSSKAVVFAVSLADCLDRNAQRKRKVPEEVLKRLYQEWEFPRFDEGLDDIQVLVASRDPFNLPGEVKSKALMASFDEESLQRLCQTMDF